MTPDRLGGEMWSRKPENKNSHFLSDALIQEILPALASTVATVSVCHKLYGATNLDLLIFTGFHCYVSFQGGTIANRSNIAPKGNESHYNIRKNIGIFGELVVSFKVPVGWNIILLIFKEIDCFPSQICRTGRPCHWPEPVMPLGFGCCGFLGVVGFGFAEHFGTVAFRISAPILSIQNLLWPMAKACHHHSVKTGTV